jgi:hypothetical protein
MKKLTVAAVVSFATLIGVNTAFASEQECKKLKEDSDVIYASKGFCFKDPDAKSRFNNNADCYTNKPKFSDAEQAKLDSIKERQKELKCK